jgi:urease accessory protein
MMEPLTSAAPRGPGKPPNDAWQAELSLRFGTRAQLPGTALLERRHRGPLVVQRPFHPEGDPCHVYVVHPPGGVVGGDELALRVQVDPQAHALITTPAATKFYRCDGRRSSQSQELRVSDATLEWLPQENIFYRGAEVRTATRIRLEGAARFIGWEIACLGLPARAERFDAGRLALDLELWRDDPVFIDRLRLAGSDAALRATWGLAGQEAVGTMLATPATPAEVDAVRALTEPWPLAGVTLVDGVLVLRALAPQAAPLRELFIAAWRVLRPAILGRPAHAPRIWST